MSIQRFRATSETTGISWPTKRLATWAAGNNITSIAELTTWLTNNVTTLAQARTVLIELAVALAHMCQDE